MVSFPQVSPPEPCAPLPHTRHMPRPSHSSNQSVTEVLIENDERMEKGETRSTRQLKLSIYVIPAFSYA